MPHRVEFSDGDDDARRARPVTARCESRERRVRENHRRRFGVGVHLRRRAALRRAATRRRTGGGGVRGARFGGGGFPALRYASARLWGVPAAMIVAVAQAAFGVQVPETASARGGGGGGGEPRRRRVLSRRAGWGIAGAAWATSPRRRAWASRSCACFCGEARLMANQTMANRRRRRVGGRAACVPLVRPPDSHGDVDGGHILKIAGPVFYLNFIKIAFVAVLVQSVTRIGPECAAASGVLSAIYFFFAVMGDGVSQAAQTFLPPSLGTNRAVKVSVLLLVSRGGSRRVQRDRELRHRRRSRRTSSQTRRRWRPSCAPPRPSCPSRSPYTPRPWGAKGASRRARRAFHERRYLPNSLLAYVTLIAMPAGDRRRRRRGHVRRRRRGIGRRREVFRDRRARFRRRADVHGDRGRVRRRRRRRAVGVLAHFNFMRLALNIGRMFVAGFSGKRGSPLLRPP